MQVDRICEHILDTVDYSCQWIDFFVKEAIIFPVFRDYLHVIGITI